VTTAAQIAELKDAAGGASLSALLAAANPATWPSGMASFGARWENAARIPSYTCEVVGVVDSRYALVRVPSALNVAGAGGDAGRCLTAEMVSGRDFAMWVDPAGIADAAVAQAEAAAVRADAVDGEGEGEEGEGNGSEPSGGNGGGSGGGGGAWSCPMCTFANGAAAARCEMCDTRRP